MIYEKINAFFIFVKLKIYKHFVNKFIKRTHLYTKYTKKLLIHDVY